MQMSGFDEFSIAVVLIGQDLYIHTYHYCKIIERAFMKLLKIGVHKSFEI